VRLNGKLRILAETAEELGIHRHAPQTQVNDAWDFFITLKDAPAAHPDSEKCVSSIYRGIVPAKNIERHDFAINGAVVCGQAVNPSNLFLHLLAVLRQYWLHIGGVSSLDIFVLPQRYNAASVFCGRSTGCWGVLFRMAEEAVPQCVYVSQRELLRRRLLVGVSSSA
jgi:hypothetical protein